MGLDKVTNIGGSWNMLEGIEQEFLGEVSALNPVIGQGRDGIVLIDTGGPGTLDQLVRALDRHGLKISDISLVLITHYHFDHVGNLAEIAKRNKNARIMMGGRDIPYYAGEAVSEEGEVDQDELLKYFPNMKESDLEQASNEEDQPFGPDEELISRLEPVNEEEMELDIAGGFRVISTPGHSPGHLSVYLEKYKALIPGDLMMYWKGNFSGPIRTFSSNIDDANESVKKVSRLEIEKLAGYHGQPYFGDVNRMINEYLRSL